jgi:hypothetical protein
MADVDCAAIPYIFMKCGSALAQVFFVGFLAAFSEVQRDSVF